MNSASSNFLASAALGCLAIATPALAQGNSDGGQLDGTAKQLVEEAAETASREGTSLLGDGSPADRSLAGFSRPTLSFDSEQEETSVSLAFSFDLQQSSAPVQEDGDDYARFNVSRTRLNIVATAPLEEGESLGNLFQGDSLVTGTKLRLSLSRLSNRLGNGAASLNLIDPAFKKCITTVSSQWLAQNPGLAAGSRDVGTGLIDKVERTAFTYRAVLDDIGKNANAGTIQRELYTQCAPGQRGVNRFLNVVELIEAQLGKDIREAFVDKRSVFQFWGIEGTAGTDSYSYLDSTAFEITETNRTSWEVSGFYGFITPDGNHSFRAKAVYGKAWELPDETELCRTFVETMEEKCLMGANGVPISEHTGVFSVESRHRFEFIEGQKIALAPQATYRLDDDSFGVEVPVYLTADDDGNLTGGIKFGYNTKDDDIAIGVFVGVPFNINF